MQTILRVIALVCCSFFSLTSASAQLHGSSAASERWRHEEALFDDISEDTGWWPRSGPIQVRVRLRVVAQSDIEVGGEVELDWPRSVELGLNNEAMSSSLHVQYGYQLEARMRFNIRAFGRNFGWEGDLPGLGGVPRDLLGEDLANADSWLLDGDTDSPLMASGMIPRTEVYSYNFSPIPFVEASVGFDVELMIEAWYRTLRVKAENSLADISRAEEKLMLELEQWLAAHEETMHPEGELSQRLAAKVFPNVTIGIDNPVGSGGTSRSLDVAEIPVSFPKRDASIIFEDKILHFALPNLEDDEPLLAEGRDVAVSIRNSGEQPLVVSMDRSEFFPNADEMIEIMPGSRRSFVLGEPLLGYPTTISFKTNDPDRGEVDVRVPEDLVVEEMLQDSSTPMMNDAGIADATVIDEDNGGASGGCDCHAGTAGLNNTWTIGLAFLMLFARRRRK